MGPEVLGDHGSRHSEQERHERKGLETNCLVYPLRSFGSGSLYVEMIRSWGLERDENILWLFSIDSPLRIWVNLSSLSLCDIPWDDFFCSRNMSVLAY